MRDLNKKQKKMIDKWFNDNWQGQGSLYTIEQMSPDLMDKVMNINLFENFIGLADDYVSNKIEDKMYQK